LIQKIVTFLWFNDNAEDAINFYLSVFEGSGVVTVTRNLDDSLGPKDSLLVASFELEGQTFYAMNGGPSFAFTPAISLFVRCESQNEIDDLWEKLLDGGEVMACGWLKDKFGLCWQICPTILIEMLSDPDPSKAIRIRDTMMTMTKIVIADLEKAYNDV
jgi:predicted 3-demethylubiquinone-9 3-methyltransferase (glyoxalase superfamily)